ncbi:MAG: LysM peptidoglycan-binding domain-containing protein, partial [Alloprevotella sp.]|nr:LysM peptidoglycan-binding domain-containing protein [Alloprevotella sp.]
LEVNSLVDERRDPIKSSYAAAKYLSDLYKIYNDWNLVIAAYNCGPGNVNKAIHRANGAKDYWVIYPYLPKETRGYVPAFIAANYIMNYYCEHNICPMRTKLPVSTDTIMVDRDIHIEQIAAYCGIDRDAIKALNPQYRTDIIPGKSAPRILRLPQENLLAFIDNQDSICNYRADELLTRRATVAVDEATALSNNNTTSTGKGRSAKANSKRNKTSKRSKTATVKKGDTLSEIAARNHTTVSNLRRLNGIKGDRIKPGQKLKVK